MEAHNKIKIVSLGGMNPEKEMNDFLSSGAQMMQDGITYLPNHVIFFYREEGAVGMPMHTKLNSINNEIQNSQKTILKCIGKIDEAQVMIEQYEGTEEGKNQLIKSKEQEEAQLGTERKVLVKLISMYNGVKDGSISV